MITGRLKNRFLILLTDKERRENRRITQSEIASATDIAPQTIARWIRNDVSKFEAPVIEKFCAYFDCELADLLYIDRSQPESER